MKAAETDEPDELDLSDDALLAFPSEVAGEPEPGATTDVGKATTDVVNTASTDVGNEATTDGGNEATTAAGHEEAPGISPSTASFRRLALFGGASLVVVIVSALVVYRYSTQPFVAPPPRPGVLTINTRPNAADILIDGVPRGTTPLTLSLAPGAHTMTVRRGSDERVVPLTLSAGAEVSQYFEMKADEPAVAVGQVSVTTDPPGARVSVDGKVQGTSPVIVNDLAPAEHTVTVTSEAGSARRTVTVPAGGTASVMFALSRTASGPVGGWLSISAPFDIDVAEHDEVIGTSATSRIMLASGKHDLTLINRDLGYQETRNIDITAGKTMAIRIEPPKVSVSVNARPWAEVTLDGNSVGQTPLANLLVAVGRHEIVYRHPQFVERKESITVTLKGPNRIATDLTK